MVVAAYVKDPQSIKDYLIDWTPWLSAGDTITGSTWTAPAGITIGTTSSTTMTTTVWLSGGVVGTEYLVLNHISTAQGRQEDQTIIILCINE